MRWSSVGVPWDQHCGWEGSSLGRGIELPCRLGRPGSYGAGVALRAAPAESGWPGLHATAWVPEHRPLGKADLVCC